jgi:hypothetical protein
MKPDFRLRSAVLDSVLNLGTRDEGCHQLAASIQGQANERWQALVALPDSRGS